MNKVNFFKYIVFIVILGTILFWAYPAGKESNDHLTSSQYDAIVHQYEAIKRAEQSNLQDILLQIVNVRLKCYLNTSEYSLRLSECRKQYEYDILRAARENLKSSPSLGEFMLCIQNCPLAYSFCNGEELVEGKSIDCRNIEILCIENCLDMFWRGSSLSESTN